MRIGVDFGGTFIKAALVEEANVRAHASVPTNAEAGPEAVLDSLAAAVRQLGAKAETVGVAIPGEVDDQGICYRLPNVPGFGNYPMRRQLETRLGCRVSIENDATAAALAERLFGWGTQFRSFLLVTLGTGIGGGLILGGELQRGTNGFAGEFGHMVVDRDGIACVCGQRGCWERYASGSALRRMAGGRRGEEVVDAARDHDPASVALIAEFAHWVAIGLCNLTNLVDPACLVIGGGLAASADVLLPPIREAFESLLYSPEHRPHPQLRFAELGEQAGAIGAAMLPIAHHH